MKKLTIFGNVIVINFILDILKKPIFGHFFHFKGFFRTRDSCGQNRFYGNWFFYGKKRCEKVDQCKIPGKSTSYFAIASQPF